MLLKSAFRVYHLAASRRRPAAGDDAPAPLGLALALRRRLPGARFEMGMSTLVQLLLAASAAALSTTSVVSPARGARSELLELLGPRASLAPVPITGRVAELVEELEQAAMVPATPSFLAFGLNGRWQLRALEGPEDLDPAAGPPLHSLALLRHTSSHTTCRIASPRAPRR